MPHGDKKETSESKIHIAREQETESDASETAASAQDPQEAKGAGSSTAAKNLTSELDELRQTLIRRQADFDNYRKRVERERGDDSRRTTAYTLERFLPMLDAFEQALATHREPAYADYRKGFELIHKQFLDALTRLGVERMDPTGQPFDPHLHQAVDRIESTEHADGTVVAVLLPGYLYNGKALRPAAVRVAVHPQGHSPEAPSKANTSASKLAN
ncbi:MAG TPA: nucleotide exchange factor GrpE [Candidatus Dormibacteraeota bacterium]|nr:nucleotide exchange factor GrpE [Candidatus Dormibacteraeota bacterium]